VRGWGPVELGRVCETVPVDVDTGSYAALLIYLWGWGWCSKGIFSLRLSGEALGPTWKYGGNDVVINNRSRTEGLRK
jgi:hypothetical protein